MSPLRSFPRKIASDFPPPTALWAPVEANEPPVAVASKKVLIVDDDAVILRTTSFKLRSRGYAVVTATDGAAAIKAVRQETPDLILLDLGFPPDVGHGGNVGWDGLRIISWLRRMEAARSIPIIIITGRDPASCKPPLMAAGAFAFVSKPIDHESLLSTIKHLLDPDAERANPSVGPVFDIGL